ncbi:transcriptional regulator [Paucilactobacillus vaccinostercus DSM 20634]|uniref:Transcriptional regulator n=1 Tax=Paucilactobacillus vaccinostercus DSM 20634 TaxID=1423813 RepID=A0A0R2ADS9_9LACO|nr:MarR family transcriptional regulator [Paucilactobacillus vaccinostercus]KRM61846.1 transcriptional regulator [Paucilactobacillus vaccinostercus DSM 20634]
MTKNTAETINHEDFLFINDSLVEIFDKILRIEERELRKSRFKDITINELHLVHAITLHEQKTTSAVAHELHLSKGSLTSSVNMLVKRGYVERIRNQQDRRVINLTLTSKGRLLYRAHDAFHRQLVKSFLIGMDENDMPLIKRALTNLQNFVDEATNH